MDVNTKKEMIKEVVLIKNSQKDPKTKKGWEEFEQGLKKNLRREEIQYKLKGLYDGKEFIGYICVSSQLVEFEIKEIILLFQQLFILLGKQIKLPKNWKEQPLGTLIGLLESQFIDDSDLIKKLRDFNIIRKKAIHKLFDTSIEIKDVERQIESELTPSFAFYNDIIAPLQNYITIITKKLFEEKDKNGDVPYEARIVFNKIFEKLKKTNPSLDSNNIGNKLKI